MMKKALFFAAALLTLAGCKNETVIEDSNLGSSKTRSIVFSIGLPAGDPVTYAIHSEEEYKLSKIDVFEFEYAAAGTPDEQATLRKIFKHDGGELSLNGTQGPNNSALSLTLEVPEEDQGFRRFLFVANATVGSTILDDLTVLSEGTTIAEFMKKATPALVDGVADLRPDFLMTGYSSKVNLSPGFSSGETIMMTRAMARIDLAIHLKNPADVLTITSAKLISAPIYTGLFPTGNLTNTLTHLDPSAGSISYATKTSGITFKTDADYNKGRAAKLFYPYERAKSQFATLGQPILHLEGTYTPSGQTPVAVHYNLRFNVNIVRNYLYTFVLGVAPDETQGYKGILQNLVVKKWEDDIEIPETFSLLKATANTSSAFSFDLASHTLTLTEKKAQTLTDVLSVTSGFANDDAKVNIVKENSLVPHPNNDWISGSTTPGKVSLTVEENTSGLERTGVIWLQSAKDTEKKALYALTIVQPGS